MSRKVDLVGLAFRMARASAADQRRAYNASVRQHNAMLKQAEKDRKQEEREKALEEKDNAIQYSIEKTNEAEENRKELQSLLICAKEEAIKLEWNDFKKTDKYSIEVPKKQKYKLFPDEIKSEAFKIEATFVDKIFKSKFEKKVNEAKDRYNTAIEERIRKVKEIEDDNTLVDKQYEKTFNNWSREKQEFENEQNIHNKKIDELKEQFENMGKEAIEFYFGSLINMIDIPEYFNTQYELEYDSQSKILILDMELPIKENIPNLKQAKYVQTRKEFVETYLKEKDIDQLYDNIILQLSLRICHDIYISDKQGKVESIVFNGIYTGINKGTGKVESKCILSLQTKKSYFLNIDIRNVEPKACFNKLKGVSSSRLSELVPIAPILSINREDKRFIERIDVAYKIESQNLAAMDWEEFEHLIREIFEKEYAINGSEIRITQASRDGGVDAVMFDPDPIRGGKYVIQAKRYTNVVGVSAVRDLYGTLINEGAVKGILIKTANYGADSYDFAKDKPITLLNGANLLHILQKHGYNARIDIEEARKYFKE